MTFLKGHKFWLGKKGKKHPAWKGGLPNCFSCGKIICRDSKRCNSCAQKERFMRMKVWNAGKTRESDIRLDYLRPTQWKKKDARISGEKQHSWKGGITKLNHKARTTIEYKILQKKVFERDNYTCQICGKRNVYLHVDHIESFAEYIKGRFNLRNCRSLCRECHYFITFKRVMPKSSKWGIYLRKEIN